MCPTDIDSEVTSFLDTVLPLLPEFYEPEEVNDYKLALEEYTEIVSRTHKYLHHEFVSRPGPPVQPPDLTPSELQKRNLLVRLNIKHRILVSPQEWACIMKAIGIIMEGFPVHVGGQFVWRLLGPGGFKYAESMNPAAVFSGHLPGFVLMDICLIAGPWNRWSGKNKPTAEDLEIMGEVSGLVAECGFNHVIAMGEKAQTHLSRALGKKHGAVNAGVINKHGRHFLFGTKTIFWTLQHPQNMLPRHQGSKTALLTAQGVDNLIGQVTGRMPEAGRGCEAWVAKWGDIQSHDDFMDQLQNHETASTRWEQY
jgi:hypothetical protein